LSSVQITEILSDELLKENKIEVVQLPLSDGGDGFLEVLKFIYEEEVKEKQFDCEFAGMKFSVPVLFKDSTQEIFIESAEVIGLKKIPTAKRNPLILNTYALGELINQIIKMDDDSFSLKRKIIIGIGGTATIDFGLGIAEALGTVFYDKQGNIIKPIPEKFLEIYDFVVQHSDDNIFNKIQIRCVADVETPLLGDISAIDLYGPQKGANPEELVIIKKGIEHILEIMKKKNLLNDISKINGAGGGLASGLKILFNAEIISSNKFLKDNLLNRIDFSEVDYIITGEGKFDVQSFEGKATGELIKKFSDKVEKLFLVCGKINNDVKKLLPQNVICFQLVDLFGNVDEAKRNSVEGLKIIADKIKKTILK
jgi:glycerate kinase